MYEELVKRLRERAAWINFPHHGEECPTEDAMLMMQAADAIEELAKDLERSKEYETFWNKEAEEALRRFQVAVANKPRWIPVTERLPDKWTWVLVCFDGADVPSTGFVNSAGDWIGEDMYTNYGVSHWMPLPQPPKEEAWAFGQKEET